MNSYPLAYLVAINTMYVPAFLALFFWRKDTRKQMLIAGAIFGVIAFLSEPIFIKYYWHPEYVFPLFFKGVQIGSFEDFFYGFIKGGIAAVIYEEVFNRTVCKMREHVHHWKRMIVPIYLGGIILFLFPTIAWGVNPVFSAALSVLLFSIYLLIYRRDLLINAISSGLLIALATYLGYLTLFSLYPGLLEAWWKLDTLTGFSLTGIPLEELLEGFMIGFFGGVFYEFFNGLRLRKVRKH